MKSIFTLMCILITLVACAQSLTNKSSKKESAIEYPLGKWSPPPKSYGSQIESDLTVKMDDGIILDAVVAYPTDLATGKKAQGKFPVIVEHTPYVKLTNTITPITYFTERGYIYAVVRVRGSGKSDGEIDFTGKRDGQDGQVVINWAANELSASDGRVAMVGCSWPGATALNDAAYAGKNSPLKVVVAACIGFETRNRESWMTGGLTTTGFWGFMNSGAALVGNTPAAERFMKNMNKEVKAGGDPAYLQNFWKERLPMSLSKKVVANGIPVLFWTGWNDNQETGALRTIVAIQNAAAKQNIHSPLSANHKTDPRWQILVGDGRHTEGLDLGLYLQWIETWLKGVDTGLQNSSKALHLYESGSNRWVSTSGFPLSSKSKYYNLTEGSKLIEGNKLSRSQMNLTWGEPSAPGSKLYFDTSGFAEGATIAGPMSATIHASSTTKNLVLIARLYDISEKGESSLVSKGVVVGSLRDLDQSKSWKDDNGVITWPWPKLEKDNYLTPTKIYKFEISLAPRLRAILPNHKLRLELTTKMPIEVCPETTPPPVGPAEPCRLTDPQEASVKGTYTLYFGSQNKSKLNIPLLPYKHFKTVRSVKTPVPWMESPRTIGDSQTNWTLPVDWNE